MAQIVGAFGVPHNPHFPALAATADTPLADEVRRMYGGVVRHLAAVGPDAIIFFTSDHYNSFWRQIPIFAIGAAPAGRGPSDYPDLPTREVPIDAALARHVHGSTVAAGFDVGVCQEVVFDHTVTAPLAFLTPGYAVPVVPVYVNGLIRPIPSSARCFALGRAVAAAVASYPADLRVAVVASGSFSLEIGGPRIFDDHHTGVPDPGWLDRVLALLRSGDTGQIVREATDEQLWRAGNAGGELLNWLAMFGAAPARAPAFLDVQPRFGHAYAAWPCGTGEGRAVRQPAVDVHPVNEVCYRVVHEPDFRRALRDDPAGTLREVRPALAGDQLDALLAGDVGTLSRMGANNFMLHNLARFEVLGLDLVSYAERIRAEYAGERARWRRGEQVF
ncbi:MAG: hypothetical protein V7603_4639 [Micromonosporaceae bacterium]